MTKIEELKNELVKERERLIAKGCKWDPETGNLLDIKPFEIAYQDAIERVFPDYIWWQLTNYWDIFDAMASGLNDEEVIDEIINHIDSSVLDDNVQEIGLGASVEEGHTLEEYREKFGELYDEGELWDFSEEDFKGGAIEINPDMVYWKIEVDGEPRYFETCQECVKSELEEEDELIAKKLTEGTSNFPIHNDFDLLVFYTLDEFLDLMHNDPNYPQEVSFEDEDGNVDEEAYWNAVEEFETKFDEENKVCVLDVDREEELENKLESFNEETKDIAYELDVDENGSQAYGNNINLEDVELKVEPGYYSGAYIEVAHEESLKYCDENVCEEQTKRIKDFLEELRKEFGLTKLGLAWGPASNGETAFKIIEEEKDKKARIVGNPEVEMAFFNHANGQGECVIKEEDELKLPREVAIDIHALVDDDIDLSGDDYNLDEVISDWLSDEYGYCHFGFEYEYNFDKDPDFVYVTNIKWDTSESCSKPDDTLKEEKMSDGKTISSKVIKKHVRK